MKIQISVNKQKDSIIIITYITAKSLAKTVLNEAVTRKEHQYLKLKNSNYNKIIALLWRTTVHIRRNNHTEYQWQHIISRNYYCYANQLLSIYRMIQKVARNLMELIEGMKQVM